ncbi:MAG: rod shape-determining protein RodA [Bacteroidales bacterium]|nr:rod shape-determining protein RodA [Bacteroidales bacterium]
MRDLGGHRGRGLAKTIDWKLVICYLLLILIGWANIYASIHSSEPASVFDFDSRSGKQFVWIITAFCIAAIILFAINPRVYESMSVPIYLFVMALLIAVIFLGIEVKGSRSWFAFGAIRFQPAEISKISTSLMLATVMSQQNYRIGRAKDFIVTAMIILVPMLIIVLQSETGSALVYVGFLFMLYREGLSGWLIFLVGMSILSFILTLTASSYVAILVIVGIASLCICLYSGRFKWWLIAGIPLIVLFAFVPTLMNIWTESLIGAEGLEALAAAEGDFIAAGVEMPFTMKIKPIYILLGFTGLCIPVTAYTAYRERNIFSNLAIISMLAGIALVFSAEFIFNDVLQDHQRKRIEVLLGMKEDPTGVGYNVNQSMIAIGSGGLTGKGYLNGTQTTYGFVPEQSTDFIFCTVGEEWGFLGSTFVILLYVFLIWRIIRNAERSREAFTRIYGYCVACCIFMHLFINIGMTIGLMPVIGIPLPFVSYGGSSLWGFSALLFIFIALDRNERKYF